MSISCLKAWALNIFYAFKFCRWIMIRLNLTRKVPFPLWGKWKKNYMWQGQPHSENAIIKADSGYYLEGEHSPRYWLRCTTFNPKTRRVRFTMVELEPKNKLWDTEILTLSENHKVMEGYSETSGCRVRYERFYTEEDLTGTSGQ